MLIKIGQFKPQYYNGILEKAFMNVHKEVFNQMSPILSKESVILDFGCGEGAFSQRLKDHGYVVHSADIDKDQFKASVDKYVQLDLNKENLLANFEDKYDCVFAMEVIEHVENPWKFVRDIKSLLKPGGIMVITTPNISNFSSRIRFLQKGRFQGFEEADLEYGHITTLTSFHLEHIFTSEKMMIISKKSLGKIPFFHFDNLSIFVILKTLFLPVLYPFMVGDHKRWCLMYVLKTDNN